MSLSAVTLKLPFSYDGKARRRCRNDGCNVSLWRLLMRRCNDVVFATPSDASIALYDDAGWQSRNNVVTTSFCLLGMSKQYISTRAKSKKDQKFK